MSRFAASRFLSTRTRDESGFTLASVAAATAIAGASATVIMPTLATATTGDMENALSAMTGNQHTTEEPDNENLFYAEGLDAATLPHMTEDVTALPRSTASVQAVDQNTRADAEALVVALEAAMGDDPSKAYVVSEDAYNPEETTYALTTTEWGHDVVTELTKHYGTVVFTTPTQDQFTVTAYNHDGGEYSEYGNHLAYSSTGSSWGSSQAL